MKVNLSFIFSEQFTNDTALFLTDYEFPNKWKCHIYHIFDVSMLMVPFLFFYSVPFIYVSSCTTIKLFSYCIFIETWHLRRYTSSLPSPKPFACFLIGLRRLIIKEYEDRAFIEHLIPSILLSDL